MRFRSTNHQYIFNENLGPSIHHGSKSPFTWASVAKQVIHLEWALADISYKTIQGSKVRLKWFIRMTSITIWSSVHSLRRQAIHYWMEVARNLLIPPRIMMPYDDVNNFKSTMCKSTSLPFLAFENWQGFKPCLLIQFVQFSHEYRLQ